MKKKVVSVVMLTLLLMSVLMLSFNVQPAQAYLKTIERKVGVDIADWATYDFFIGWSSDDPSPPSPIPPPWTFDVDWFKIFVQNIVETNITLHSSLHFKNGTEQTVISWVDIDTGYGGGRLFFISADLDVGDNIYNKPYEPTINETVTRVYAGAAREVNHLSVSMLWASGDYSFVESVNAYWDRTTGVLCEGEGRSICTHQMKGYVTSLSVVYVLIGTNIWEPSIPSTIQELKTEVEELDLQGEIDNKGIVKSLSAKLNVAQKLIDKGKIDEAKSILEEDFIPQVQNLSGIHITPEAADTLIESAEYIISHL